MPTKVLSECKLYSAKCRTLFFPYLQNIMLPFQECHEQVNTRKTIIFSNKFKYKKLDANDNSKDTYSEIDEHRSDCERTALIVSDDLMIDENEVIRSRSKKKKKKCINFKGEILFGLHPVHMALKHQRREFYKLFLKQDNIEERNHIDGLKLEIKNLAIKLGIEVTNIDVWKMNNLAPGCVHQGVCLDASKFPVMKYEDIKHEAKDSSQYLPLWLILNGIQDPMNVGAIIRTAYYFGVNKIFVSKYNSCRLSPVVSKASSGALEVVDIFQISDVAEFLQNKKNDGWSVLSTTAYCNENDDHTDRSIIDVGQCYRTKPTILLLGNEGKGIKTALQNICDATISILPKYNHNCEIDSLNVSVAAGVILYHLHYLGKQSVLMESEKNN